MNDLSKSRLLEVLSTFSPGEWRQLHLFIESGLGGPNIRNSQLMDYLSVFYPDFSSPQLHKEALFFHLYPDLPYEDKKVRYAMTELLGTVNHYLTFSALNRNQLLSGSLLKESLAQRQSDRAFLHHYAKDANAAAEDAGNNAEFYYYRFRDEYTFLNDYLPRQKRTGERPLENASRNLDIYYLAKKLQLLCEAINAGNVMSTNVEFFLKDEIIDQLRNGAYSEVPVIGIYFRILMTLSEPDDEKHFPVLKSLLETKTDGFESDELRDMYQYLMNYCIRKINLGDTNFVSTLFSVYKTILNRELIFNDGMISQWDYKNIVTIGVRSGEIAWVAEFIENYKNRLNENERENAYVYNTAYLNFALKNYKKAIQTLQQVEFTDLYYQLDMRAVLLKCYFEMDDEDALFYHIAAFKIFLTRNKLVSDYQRTIYRNLVKYTTQLVKAAGNKKRLEKISEEINKVKQIADIGWLKGQVESYAR